MEQQQKPVVYLLYGNDTVAIDEAVADLKSRLGDSSAVELNFLALDGRSSSIDQLETSARSMPFLAGRRLTVLKHPLALLQADANRERIFSLLSSLSEKSAVVLAEHGPLPPQKKKKGKIKHWLLLWAETMGGRVFVKEFNIQGGPRMIGWVNDRVSKAGGEIDPGAATKLVALVGEDVELADQEIGKLLTYVNYERRVTEADVEELTAVLPEGRIFNFVDALGNRDQESAVREFHLLLADNDIQRIFPMIVRQFRLLVQSREILDQRGGEREITSDLKVHQYVGGKLAGQARHFTQAQLDEIFHRLLQIDAELKTGVMATELNVDLLIAEIT